MHTTKDQHYCSHKDNILKTIQITDLFGNLDIHQGGR